jgi:hypothetical protein
VDAGARRRAGELRQRPREEKHRDRRRQRERGERGERAGPAGAQQAEAEAELARRRPGQELREREELREPALVDPAALLDELAPVVADVRDRPAEGRQAQAQEGAEDLGGGALVADRATRP